MPSLIAHRPPPEPRQLQRCLLLAALLHVWLVLVFGNATGTAAPGEGVWGSLTVKLAGRSGSESGTPPGEPVKAWRDNGAPGAGTQQRQGGQVRPEVPALTSPGAAKLGRWNPREVAPEAARTEELSAAPPSTATLTLPPGFQPLAREDLTAPSAADAVVPAPDLPAPVNRLEAPSQATVAPLPTPASLRPAPHVPLLPSLPADLPSALSRLEATPAPDRARSLPRPADLRTTPVAVPAPPPNAPLPPPVRRLEAPPEAGATAALPRAADLRSALPAPAPALPSNPALPAAVQRLKAAPGEAPLAPLPRSSELRAPVAAPAPTALHNAQELPSPVRRLEPADAAGAVAPLQPTAHTRPALAAPQTSALPEIARALPGQVNAPAATAGPARGNPAADPSAHEFAAPKASAGSPEAGSRLGQDVAVPPSASASAPRAPLNLSLPRGGDISARRGPGLVDLLPQPPERKSKLEQSIEDTANKDCRKAYADTGILAAIPLAVDAARGKGCKW